MGCCRRRRRRMSHPGRVCWPSRSISIDMARRAVVLMNLGGPDSPKAVRPFLYNLFRDPAIIGLPTVGRLPLGWLIAARGYRVAAVKEWQPDEAVLLPLYPQFSTATTGSSLTAWHEEAQRQGLASPTQTV